MSWFWFFVIAGLVVIVAGVVAIWTVDRYMDEGRN